MKVSDIFIYTILAIVMLYVLGKINEKINESFDEVDAIHRKHHKMGIAHKSMGPRHHSNMHIPHKHDLEIEQYPVKNKDNIHHISIPTVMDDNNIKLGNIHVSGRLETQDDLHGYCPDKSFSLDKIKDDSIKLKHKKHSTKYSTKQTRFQDAEHFDDLAKNAKNDRCTVDHTDEDADTYLRKKLLVGPSYKSAPMNSEELKNYRDNHFAFRNQVWQTSKDVDMVDKINDMYFSGNDEPNRNTRGQKIADLFDGLTQNEDKLYQQCISNSGEDSRVQRLVNPSTSTITETGHNGKFISNINWQYENEKIMNGGQFFNNIKPFDGICSVNQAL